MMGKKKQRDQGLGIGDQKVEKQITGSGADVERGEDAASTGKVKCKCIVPCVWRGYRDEGDTVWIEKELIEKDAFIKMHFETIDGVVADAGQDGQGQDRGKGHGDGGSDNEDGANGNGNGGSDNADGGSDNADGADGNGDGADGNGDGADGNGDSADGNDDGEGQGELDLK